MTLHTPFTITFPDGITARAVRASPDDDPAAVVKTLELPAASGLLMLSGGADQMSNATFEQLAAAFGPVGAALAQAGVTVIDGGTDSGVMALMGRALARGGRTAPYIGVVPAHAEVKPGGPHGEDMLEPHHSHFVLVESGEWGGETRLMYGLAAYFSAHAPSISILANGGGIALKEAEWNVEQRREIIFLSGSGRLADEVTSGVHRPDTAQRRIAKLVRYDRVTLFDLAQPPEKLVDLIMRRLS